MSRPRRAIRRSPLERLSSLIELDGLRDRLARRAATPRGSRAEHGRSTHHAHHASGYVRSVVAAVAISALGLAAAGAVTLTSSAQTAGDRPTVVASDVPSAFDDRAQDTSRSNDRAEGTDRAKALESAADQAEAERNSQAAKDRDKQLGDEAKKTDESRKQIEAAAKQAQQEANSNPPRTTRNAPRTYTPPDNGAKRVYPLSNYNISGRFGQYGPWSRWHTGTDFSAPIGTPIHSIAAGIVTHVGYGSQASWAGFYITVMHPDGYTTLYAHQNPSSYVSVGQTVRAGQQIGVVGMTGRSFGPHCHVELYPPGTVPGDIYNAVDVIPYIRAGR